MLSRYIWIPVFNFLHWKELVRLTQVCRFFERLIKSYPWDHLIRLFWVQPILFVSTYHFQQYSIRGDISIDFLKQLHGVRYLNLMINNITDDHLVYLNKIPHLKLDNDSYFTDNGLVHLANIQILDLSSCHQITDAGLMHLGKINTLILHDCQGITDAGLEHLTDVSSVILLIIKFK